MQINDHFVTISTGINDFIYFEVTIIHRFSGNDVVLYSLFERHIAVKPMHGLLCHIIIDRQFGQKIPRVVNLLSSIYAYRGTRSKTQLLQLSEVNSAEVKEHRDSEF